VGLAAATVSMVTAGGVAAAAAVALRVGLAA